MFFLNKTKVLLAASTAVVLLTGQTAAFAGSRSMNRRPVYRVYAKHGAGISDVKQIRQILIKPKPGVNIKEIEAVGTRVGGQRVSKLPKLGVIKVTLGNGDIDKALSVYNASGLVEYAEPNYTRKAASFTPNDPLFQDQWGLTTIGMPQAWEKVSNPHQVKVAVLDTGVDTAHEDLQGMFAMDPNTPGQILGKHFFTDSTGKQASDNNVQDNSGHGTHISGIIAAVTNNNLGVAGIAAGARIMPVKVLDDVGLGDDANIAEGLMWAADNGARVVNMSLSGPAPSKTLDDAVTYAHDRGVIIVAATGNDGVADPNYPAAYDGVIGVGATDNRDVWMHQSNFGPYVDVVAPGVSVLSTFPPTKTLDGSAYDAHTGTSMATGFVSGLAALILSESPNLSSDRIEGIMYVTADDLGTAGWDRYYGHGRIDASRSVDLGDSTDNTKPSVSIASPVNGSKVSGTSVTVSASAADADSGIAFVDFFVNGERVGSSLTPPYKISVNSDNFEGKNTVEAIAYDKSGNSSSSEVTCYRQTFSDVAPSYWAFEDIEALTASKIISGYPGGVFRPGNSVSRAEFVKMLMEGMGLSKKSYYSGYFKDVPSTSWAWPYIEAAYDMGLVTGYSKDAFAPDKDVKRDEVTTMLIKTGAFAIDYSGSPFADVPVGHWAYAYVMSARNASIINGYAGNVFRPERSMNRAEAARVIKNSFFY